MLILMKLFDLIARFFYFLGDTATRVKTSLWARHTGILAEKRKLAGALTEYRVPVSKSWREEITSMKESSGLEWTERVHRPTTPPEAP